MRKDHVMVWGGQGALQKDVLKWRGGREDCLERRERRVWPGRTVEECRPGVSCYWSLVTTRCSAVPLCQHPPNSPPASGPRPRAHGVPPRPPPPSILYSLKEHIETCLV